MAQSRTKVEMVDCYHGGVKQA